MTLNALFGSGIARRAGALSLLVEAALSWSGGDRRTAVLLLGVAGLAYRWNGLGVAAEVALRLHRWRR